VGFQPAKGECSRKREWCKSMTAELTESDILSKKSELISLGEACQRAAAHAKPIESQEKVSVADALGRVLAGDVRAQIALPRFDQSAMDGYAFAASSVTKIRTELEIISRVPAGDRSGLLPGGTAARIFTGAPIPQGADTVVIQEHVGRNGARLIVEGPIRKGSNVRCRGEDIAKGELLLGRGQRLDVQHLALLSAQGYSSVKVLRRPRVAIVSTGDEIRRPGESLGEACVYDSNLPMLMAIARRAGLETHDGGRLPDNADAMARNLGDLAESFDLVVTTGGASVGEEDHSAAAAAAKGSSFESLKIAVKPGKPALVGRIGQAVYLGLPGNPVSCLVSWLFLGNAIIAALNGVKPKRPIGYSMGVTSDFNHRPGRTEFAPARVVSAKHGPQIEILGRGGSARLKPLIHAQGLAEISSECGDLSIGDSVLFHPFRDGFTL
jgi:molybdopterin molybdotransferase